MKQLLKKIGITDSGYYNEDGNYVIDIEDSNSFNIIYGKLDNNDEIEENEDASNIDLDITNIIYFCDNFAIQLTANFEQDEYKLTIFEADEGEDD